LRCKPWSRDSSGHRGRCARPDRVGLTSLPRSIPLMIDLLSEYRGPLPASMYSRGSEVTEVGVGRGLLTFCGGAFEGARRNWNGREVFASCAESRFTFQQWFSMTQERADSCSLCSSE